MYRGKDREQKYLFKELTPFGGALNEGNRWMRIREMIPWGELEREYSKYFSRRGRPGLDGRLIIGLFLLKHMTSRSDREIILELQENVYWQAFYRKLNSSSLTKIRKKLGVEFTKQLEKKTYRALIEKKIIRAKGLMADATVIPEKIKYPNDIGLLNDVREWIIGQLRDISRTTGEKIRTYRRKARKVYLNFAKKKQKTQKMIRAAERQMLQYVRRNIHQLQERIGDIDWLMREAIEKRLKIARKIWEQQYYMHREKVLKVEDSKLVA